MHPVHVALYTPALHSIGANSFQRVVTGVYRAGLHLGSRALDGIASLQLTKVLGISISNVCHSASGGQLGLQSALLEGRCEGGQCCLPGWPWEQGDEHPERAALGWL